MLVKRKKNIWAKERKQYEPYLEWTADGWTYRVLKAYQTRANEEKNQYARWFMAIQGPHSYGFDLGDTYINSLPLTPAIREALEQRKLREETT